MTFLWPPFIPGSPNRPSKVDLASMIFAASPQGVLDFVREATPKDWSLESRAIAIEKAYLHGELKGSTRADDAPDLLAGYFPLLIYQSVSCFPDCSAFAANRTLSVYGVFMGWILRIASVRELTWSLL
jgi:hypothetical protein